MAVYVDIALYHMWYVLMFPMLSYVNIIVLVVVCECIVYQHLVGLKYFDILLYKICM